MKSDKEILAALEAENAAFRKYLFDLQWMPEDYTDDGERQSQAIKPYVDFNRHDAAQLTAACDARFKGAKERHKARAEKLEAAAKAMRTIAGSRTSDEHGAWMRAEGHAAEDDSNESCADWMEVHDRIIIAARAALEALNA